jgi:D-alanyl-lipoteichoic acid acyltransferase DltB (MBOAT superfamily)
LWLSLAVNISLLGFFKYADFFIRNFNFLASPFGWDQIEYLNLILPVGISFYTFQTLAYTIDVYRNEKTAETNYIDFALYVGYFPQLVAGPIERAKDLIPQLKKKHQVSQEQVMHGLERILWGLIKKVVVADRLAVVVTEVYSDVSSHSGAELFVATCCFGFQLYLDFSAYTDIAIGIARMMGVKLSENFNYPYVSKSQSEHWSRWHRTLTFWFRDYVYRPIMKTGKRTTSKRLLAILVVFSLTGIWHGAYWNMFLFGFISGVYIVTQNLISQSAMLSFRSLRSKYKSFDKFYNLVLPPFNFLVLWYSLAPFFILRDISNVQSYFANLFFESWNWQGLAEEYWVYFILFWLLYATHILRAKYIPKMRSGELTVNYDRVPTNLALLLILIFGAYEYQITFIYFQF